MFRDIGSYGGLEVLYGDRGTPPFPPPVDLTGVLVGGLLTMKAMAREIPKPRRLDAMEDEEEEGWGLLA